jgi:hypothetical protein
MQCELGPILPGLAFHSDQHTDVGAVLIAFWVTFATNSSADPQDHLGTIWPKYITAKGQIVVFGNSTGPSASYVTSAELADTYSGPC